MFAAIDPGKQGAIAVVLPNGTAKSWYTPVSMKDVGGKVVNMYNARDIHRLIKMISSWRGEGFTVVFAVEQQGGRPVTSKKASEQIGLGLGYWLAFLDLYSLPFTWVSPNKWKRYMGLSPDKNTALELCRRLYPRHKIPLMKDEGRAEAVLLADYLKRTYVSG